MYELAFTAISRSCIYLIDWIAECELEKEIENRSDEKKVELAISQ